MTDTPSNDRLAGDPDMGEPIAALAAIETQASPGFIERLRRRIYRRSAGSQVASFTWYVPQMVLREFLLLIGDMLNAKGAQRRG